MPFTKEQLENWFTHHPPDKDDIEKYQIIRAAAHYFAKAVNDLCPDSADKSAAMRKIREAVMTANASIACKGK